MAEEREIVQFYWNNANEERQESGMEEPLWQPNQNGYCVWYGATYIY